MRLWGGHPSKTPVHQQQSSHEPPPVKKKAEHRENQPGYEVCERNSIPQTLARGLVYLPVKLWGFVKKRVAIRLQIGTVLHFLHTKQLMTLVWCLDSLNLLTNDIGTHKWLFPQKSYIYSFVFIFH